MKHRNALVSVAVAALWPAMAAAELRPAVSAGVVYVDNLNRVSGSQPKIGDTAFQVRPSLVYTRESERATWAASYELVATKYADNGEFDNVRHRFGLETSLDLYHDILTLDASARLSQQSVSPDAPSDLEGLFSRENSADALDIQVAPRFRRVFGRTEVDASYSYADTNYSRVDSDINAAVEDATTTRGKFRVNDYRPARRSGLSWALEYTTDRTSYAESLPFRYDQAFIEVGYFLTGSLETFARGGRESDPSIRVSEGGLDADTWDAGVRWSPDPRTKLDASVGHRFYGRAFAFSFSREARLLQVDVRYTEAPTNEVQRRILRGRPADPGLPEQPRDGFDRLGTDPFIQKDLEAGLTFTGRLLQVEVSAAQRRRQYIAGALSAQNEQQRSYGLSVSRTLSPRTTLRAFGDRGKNSVANGGRFNDRTLGLVVDWRLTQKTQLSFRADSQRREGLIDYEVNTVGILASRTF